FIAGQYFIENPGWLSGGALAWFRDTFRLSDFAELDRMAGDVPPGAEGVVFLPALSGAMAPEWIASARGVFYGLTPSHGTGHLARALDAPRRQRRRDSGGWRESGSSRSPPRRGRRRSLGPLPLLLRVDLADPNLRTIRTTARKRGRHEVVATVRRRRSAALLGRV